MSIDAIKHRWIYNHPTHIKESTHSCINNGMVYGKGRNSSFSLLICMVFKKLAS